MATFVINTTPEERLSVLQVLKNTEGETIAMSAIAKKSGCSANRVRYILEDLLSNGDITRTLTKAFNANYRRYSYKVLNEEALKNGNYPS